MKRKPLTSPPVKVTLTYEASQVDVSHPYRVHRLSGAITRQLPTGQTIRAGQQLTETEATALAMPGVKVEVIPL